MMNRASVRAAFLTLALLFPGCSLIALKADPPLEPNPLLGVRMGLAVQSAWSAIDDDVIPRHVAIARDAATHTISFLGPIKYGFKTREPWAGAGGETGHVLTTIWVTDEGDGTCRVHARANFFPWKAKMSPTMSDGTWELECLKEIQRRAYALHQLEAP